MALAIAPFPGPCYCLLPSACCLLIALDAYMPMPWARPMASLAWPMCIKSDQKAIGNRQ